MLIYTYPDEAQRREIITRPTKEAASLTATVSAVLERVRKEGDSAVLEYEQKFDKVDLRECITDTSSERKNPLRVSDEEFNTALNLVSEELKASLRLAHDNISRFHTAQRFEGIEVETAPGVRCWQRSMPIEAVGLYIPGGTAPLFSTVLMLATPARIAGCKRIVLCTPPQKDGSVHPAILVAAHIAGVSEVFKAGGVQAIGAMAYGTESVPKVAKIFGPGNQYVQCAKQLVSLSDVAIDMPAGPSEVCVIADETANAAFVAADLLSQAEHGADSQVLLITTSSVLFNSIQKEIETQLNQLPRKDIATAALDNSRCVLVRTIDEAISLSNQYAPEHLIIETADAGEIARQVTNAGSVFIGHLTPESAGDYASGTNHTLPTNGYATAYSGVNLDTFCRKITYQHITPEGILSIGRAVELMAEAEHLDAHKNAMTLRRKSLG
ncbi:MAG: histidinol dehydrogenase [Bacteroidaceae bacterium]|nr:histidinol dehydrogenase [Bacteroidaceae bacterium]